MPENAINGWKEYKQRVLFHLDQLTEKLDKLEIKLDELRDSVTILKVKASIYGAIFGLLTTVVIQVLMKIIK